MILDTDQGLILGWRVPYLISLYEARMCVLCRSAHFLMEIYGDRMICLACAPLRTEAA